MEIISDGENYNIIASDLTISWDKIILN